MTRMTPADRKAQLLDVAVELARKNGFASLRMLHISQRAECSNATVVGYFKTMVQMKRAVMRAAISREVLPIIAEGVAMRDPAALKCPVELQRKALATLAV
jgi:AcrR family transcriptional regulator